MRVFTSIDLQKQTGDVQRAASREGVVITSHGKPRNVMLSVEEFQRLKGMAKEPVPALLVSPAGTVVRHLPDPLGYDVTDFGTLVDKMSDDAINGTNGDAVETELIRLRSRFGARGDDRQA